MTFEPTFDDITRKADALPDLEGDLDDPVAPENELAPLEEDDLPPEGEE